MKSCIHDDVPPHTPVLLHKIGVQGGIVFMDMFSSCILKTLMPFV